ncbi:CDP-diacylglycerol--serine O-phosphatidyltransferase [uncultured Alistipes sp.]|uniref:CDP-diacylglycerol--serine O-phosphatidyltransferase n=1 Tax=uncultured Alistipes sp. TaxID=538949 RepID=UPI0025CFD4DA|nr:CDP-diacylglycerol--serine O-phosphatidyltransferase [uncultured Alistipes sp.]
MKIKLFTIPNLLTLSNLLCGAFALVAVLAHGDLTLAFWLMILAAVFDFLDGFVARLLRQSGPLGVQLDSLADDITFGLLPAAILFVVGERMPTLFALPQWTLWAVFVLAAFSALRLARFNIDDTQHTEFRGLPTPAAALFCASLGMLAERDLLTIPCEAVLALAAVLSLLLVSPVRMFSLKFHGFGWAGNELRYAFLAACAVLVASLRMWSLPAIIALYVGLSTLRWVLQRAKIAEK